MGSESKKVKEQEEREGKRKAGGWTQQRSVEKARKEGRCPQQHLGRKRNKVKGRVNSICKAGYS